MLKHAKYTLAMLLLCCTCSLLHAQPTVIISELFYDTPGNEAYGTQGARNGEFVTLYNYGSSAVNLSGWVLRCSGSVEAYAYTLQDGIVLQPKGYFTVAYRHRATHSFSLKNMFPLAPADNGHELAYQNALIFSNKGPSVSLHTKQGALHDEVYYSNNAGKDDTLHLKAHNGKGKPIEDCLSLQRVNITTQDGKVVFRKSDYVVDRVKMCNFTNLFITVNGMMAEGMEPAAQGGGGVVDVSPTGAATYSLPIETTFGGQGGLAPTLAITYSSQAGNGLLGWGFNVAGAYSSAVRVPKTVYLDGSASAINYDDVFSDNIAIDGNVLRQKVTYEDRIEYNFEQNNFASITLKQGRPLEQTITVTDKNGTTYTYGGDGYFRYIGSGDAMRVVEWLLGTVRDSKGNTMHYSYSHDNNGCAYIAEIDYSYGTVKFTYETRPDPIPVQISGKRHQVQWRMKSIEVYAWYNHELPRQKTYEFTYTTDVYSRLTKVEEENAANKRMPVNMFGWSGYPVRANIQSSIVGEIPAAECGEKDSYSYQSIDMNNDGLQDLVEVKNIAKEREKVTYFEKKMTLYLSTKTNGTVALKNYGEANLGVTDGVEAKKVTFYADGSLGAFGEWQHTTKGLFAANLYGTGAQELVLCTATKMVSVALGNGRKKDVSERITFYRTFLKNGVLETTQIYQTWRNSPYTVPVADVKDVDNDGRAELIFLEKEEGKQAGILKIVKLYEDAPPQITSIGLTLNSDNPKRIMVADFDGDGLQDIMLVDKTGAFTLWNRGGGIANVFANTNKSTYYFFNSEYSAIEIGDFNGDGLPDLVLNEHCNSKWHLARNDGNRNFSSISLSNIMAIEEDFTTKNDDIDRCMVVDFDGDGKSDLIISDSEYDKEDDMWSKPWGKFKKHHVYWYRSTGSGFALVRERKYDTEGASRKASNFTFGDFDGDGYTEMLHYGFDCYGDGSNEKWRMYKNTGLGVLSGKLLAVGSTTGSVTSFTYSSLPTTSCYVHSGYKVTFPMIKIKPAIHLVESMKVKAGKDIISTTFTYSGIRLHVAGKGFLGFERVTSSCKEANKHVAQTYGLHPTYYVPYLKQQKVSTADGEQPISTTDNVFDVVHYGKKSVFSYLKRSVTTDHLTGVTVTKGYGYSDNGNVISDTTDYGSNIKQVRFLGYNHSSIKGLLTFMEQHNYYGKPTGRLETFQSFGYNSKGVLTWQQSYLENPDSHTTTAYLNLTGLGLPQTVQKYATGTERVEEKLEYDGQGRITKSTNPVGQSTTYQYDAAGRLLTETNHLGHATIYVYDDYGRLQKMLQPTGEEQTNAWKVVSATTPDAPQGAVYAAIASSTDGSSQTTFYDMRNLALRTVSLTALDKKVYADTEYDLLGRPARQSHPYYTGEAKRWITYTYDQYGRMVKENNHGLTTSYGYHGLTATVTGPDGKATHTTRNAAGDVVRSTDPEGNAVDYEYHVTGQPAKITAAGATYRMEYNRWGRQTKLHDPNAGTISYRYDGWGRLQGQTDARGYTDSMVYDQLGRTVQKITPEARYTYTYNSYGLERVTRNGTAEYTYGYDSYGRLKAKTTYANGLTFTFGYRYNKYNQLDTTIYPNGYTLHHSYSHGALTAIAAGSATLWQLQDENALGQPLRYAWGTGQHTTLRYDSYGLLQSKEASGAGIRPQAYEFNPRTGNLSSRTVADKKEVFEYDNLNRLTSWSSTPPLGGGAGGGAAAYAPNGNITDKSDVGTYAYNTSRPHAVTDITSIPAACHPELVEGFPEGASQHIKYDSKNRPLYIAQGADSLVFYYDHTGQRLHTQHYRNGQNDRINYYVGSYEASYTAGSRVTRCFVAAPTGLHYVHELDYPADEEYDPDVNGYYLHTDHLGSIVAYAYAYGNMAEEYSYDPWGRLRNPHTLGLYSSANMPNLRFGRGFTGHEHLPQFGLINMNARLYDPVLGRMLSPDPYVVNAGYGQDFNRYSYARNNPLSYTDPDGEWVHIVIGAAVGGAINLGIKIYQGKVDNFADGLVAFGIGAAAGAIGAATGGAAFAAAGGAAGGAGGFIAGAAGGMVGSAFASPIQSIGNSLYFGDPLMTGKQYLMGIAVGGLLGGTVNGLIALSSGLTFWSGVPKPPVTPLPSPPALPKPELSKPELKLPNGGRSEVQKIPATTVREEGSTIYRAVSDAELNDISQAGLRNKPGAYETGKLFAPTPEEAAQFGRNNYRLDGIPNTIIEVKVPASVMHNAYKFGADGMNAISIPADQLRLMKATPMNSTPRIR